MDNNFKYVWSISLNQMVVSQFYYKGHLYKWHDMDCIYWHEVDDTRFFYEVPTNASSRNE